MKAIFIFSLMALLTLGSCQQNLGDTTAPGEVTETTVEKKHQSTAKTDTSVLNHGGDEISTNATKEAATDSTDSNVPRDTAASITPKENLSEEELWTTLEGASSVYYTESGIQVHRLLVDFLEEGEFVPFHGIQRADKTLLMFDMGSDIHDDDLKEALKNWPRISHKNLEILVPPEIEEIQKIPGNVDCALLDNRLFSKAEVSYSTMGWY